MPLQPGQTIDGKYRILRLIGEGGMGTVHEGENLLIRRRVAIKVLNAEAAANSAAVVRFEREAQAAGRIGSDHILEIIDLGMLPSGERYMVMEYLDGETLSQRIHRAGQLAPPTVYPLIRQALVGLRAAHQAGIVHRDLKPDNLFILREKAGQGDFVKIIDFGVSKFSSRGRDFSMTRTGAVVGTPFYMSPEQARGSRDIDARSDIYAMGVILYESLTGNVPFSGETFNELIFKIVGDEPVPLTARVPSLDPGFVRIVERAMARDPAQRFESAEALIVELDAWAAALGLEVPRASSFPSLIPETSSRGAYRTSQPPRSTGSSWAMSQHDRGARSGLPLALGAVAVGALLLGGALYGAYRLLGTSDQAVVQAVQAARPPAPGVSVPVAPGLKVDRDEPAGLKDDEADTVDHDRHGAATGATAAKRSEPEVKPVDVAPTASTSADTVNTIRTAPQRQQRRAKPERPDATPRRAPDFGY